MRLVNQDCFEAIKEINDASVDLVLADPPYGATRNAWDKKLNFSVLWPEIRRVCKRNAAVLLTATSPYDKELAMTNIAEFRYEWIWQKTQATGHLNANRMPMRAHENVLVFYRSLPTYNPQKTTGHKPVNSFYTRKSGTNYGEASQAAAGGGQTDRYPRTVIEFRSDKQTCHRHPTQKPVGLLRYLIKTYSNPGDTVLDFCMGSGSTGEACLLEGRNFIGIEADANYFDAAQKHLIAAQTAA